MYKPFKKKIVWKKEQKKQQKKNMKNKGHYLLQRFCFVKKNKPLFSTYFGDNNNKINEDILGAGGERTCGRGK